RPVDLVRALAEFRDELGSSGLHDGQPGTAILGQPPGGSGLGGRRDAALPARLATQPGGGRGTNGPHQLSASVADLHHDLLWPRSRPFRTGRPGGPVNDRAGSLGVPVADVLRLARLLHPGANGMAVALAY